MTRRDRLPSTVLILSLVALLLSACGKTSTPSEELSLVPAPKGDMYQPPSPLPLGEPGALIWAEKVDLPIRPPSTIWRILYHSRDRSGEDVAVSGFAFVPKAKAPAGGRPVLAWGHGTVGLGDQCAPSRNIRDHYPPFGGETLERGGVVVATDYQGLGTPGTQSHAVGVAEGRSVLDSARAVAALPNVGPTDDVILAGHSQGGAAALFAGQLAAAYAPELAIRGVVSLAPGAELATLIQYLQRSPAIGATLIGAIGLASVYPEIKLASALTPAAFADIERVSSECVDATVQRWSGKTSDAIFTADPVKDPALKRIFVENSPGASDPKVPMLIVHGENDEQVPVGISATLTKRYCRLGATVARRTYRDVNHAGVIEAAKADVLSWLTERLEGKPATSTCT